MKNVFKRGVALLSGTIFLLIAVASPVMAQNTNRVANGFRVSPVREEKTIEKGRSDNIVITVENLTDLATVAKPIVNDFIPSDKEDGEPLLLLDDKSAATKNSFRSLVNPIPDVSLAPKQKKDVTVTLSVPDDANSGGYYGAVRFAPTITGEQSNVGLTASVGTIILVTVPGNLTQKLSLVELSAGRGDQPTSFFTKGDVTVVTRLRNDGDIHVKPFGKVVVKNMFGKIVNEFEFNNTDPRANVLPGSTRKFVDKLPKSNWFGRYTIEANLGYVQGSGDFISDKANFWYFPFWSLLALGIIFLLLVLATTFVVRSIRSSRSFSRKKRK